MFLKNKNVKGKLMLMVINYNIAAENFDMILMNISIGIKILCKSKTKGACAYCPNLCIFGLVNHASKIVL